MCLITGFFCSSAFRVITTMDRSMPIYRDWKNPDAYTFTVSLDLLGWAWEFLRRNGDYQRDWLYELKRYFKSNRIRGGGCPAFFPVKGERFCLANDQTVWVNHPGFYFFPCHDHGEYIQKYGIDRFVNPNQDQPTFLPFTNHPLSESANCIGECWYDEEKAVERFGHRYRTFAVDLAAVESIDQQLERIKKTLVAERSRLKGKLPKLGIKSQQDMWKRYLRIFDAKAHTKKITYKEIAPSFFKEPSDEEIEVVKKNYQAAQKLVKSGFKKIVFRGL